MTPADKYASLYPWRFVLRRLAQALAVLLLLVVGYLLRGVLLPLFVAFVIAYALDPLVGRVARLGLGRRAAAAVVMLLMALAGMALLAVSIPYMVDEFAGAAAALPQQLRNLRERADPWLWDRMHFRLPQTWGDVTRDYGDELRQRLPTVLERVAPALFGTVGLVMVLGGSLIIPVFAFYLLLDLDVIVERAGVFVPRRHARQVYELARQVHVMLGRYVRGQLTACVVLGLFYAFGLRALGLRLGLPIGLLTGLLAFVPYVGFGFGLTLALAMAMLDWHGPGLVVGVLIVMGLGQLLDALLVTPRIVGASVGLKPIEVLVTMMAAGTLFGFVGVLLAVPLGAVVKILVVRAGQAYLRSLYYRQIPATATPTPLPGARLVDEGYLPASVRSPRTEPPPSSNPATRL